jgi:hypothetical protein
LPRSKKTIPITSRIRIEFYLPQRPGERRYEVVGDWLIRELTYLRGGTTRIEDTQGTYRSAAGDLIGDKVTVLWSSLLFSPPIPLARFSRYLPFPSLLLGPSARAG